MASIPTPPHWPVAAEARPALGTDPTLPLFAARFRWHALPFARLCLLHLHLLGSRSRHCVLSCRMGQSDDNIVLSFALARHPLQQIGAPRTAPRRSNVNPRLPQARYDAALQGLSEASSNVRAREQEARLLSSPDWLSADIRACRSSSDRDRSDS